MRRNDTAQTPRRRPVATSALAALFAAAVTGLALSCSNESSSGNPSNTATSGSALTAAEVERLLARAAAQADALNQSASIAVLDREGEVLGVFTMNGRDTNGDGITDTPGAANAATAISKAATAAAFQSEGEAFTTRTAFFIVQGNFPPGAAFTPAGPLFGVQDSGMANSDAHILAFDQNGNAVGGGVSGELGGVPIYKNGAPVGGLGVDTVTPVTSVTGPGAGTASTAASPVQVNLDEQIAIAGLGGEFETPDVIRATNVFVDGQAFPFYGASLPVQSSTPTTLASVAGLGSVEAQFPVRASPLSAEVRVSGEYGVRPTARFLGRLTAPAAPTFSGTLTNVDRPASVAIDSSTLTFTGVPIQALPQRTLAGGVGEDRLTPIASVEPTPANGGLSAAEVTNIISAAVDNARSSIAGIRLPRGSSVTVHVAVVDRRGNILGLYRMADGTLFSSDIAVQKARTAAFFSTDGSEGLPAVAFTARAIGFLAQPFFPPGINSTIPGPLVNLRDLLNRGRIPVENPPSNRIVFPPPRLPSDGTTDEDLFTGGNQFFDDYTGTTPSELTEVRTIQANTGGICLLMDRPDTTPNFVSPGMQSGIMTFPGAVPLYRNGQLIGAIGVSGDGVDEDDAASFAGAAIGFQAPQQIRCDAQNEQSIAQVLSSKVDTLADAVEAHPDLRIRNVYGPILRAEVTRIQQRLTSGLDRVRIPYIKLPRNPTRF